MNDCYLPYYLAGLPVLLDQARTQRRCYWAAQLGPSTLAGHAHHTRRVVLDWLRGAGFTEAVVTYDLLHIADIVGELRAVWRAGHRADKIVNLE